MPPHSPRILLADEDPGVRRTLALVLTWAGYRVSTAEHTVDAILLLQKIVPDLIIFDLDLDHVPGYDFLSMVRRRLPQVSVIATTISTTTADACAQDGLLADAIYVKGLSRTETLLESVASLLRTSGSRALEHQNGDLRTSIPKLKIMRAGR
ncbi:MAG TPA: response regulator [Candidatus Angelobacter sp.]|nr:response regulator [Candidatus Angelobacter sp.]